MIQYNVVSGIAEGIIIFFCFENKSLFKYSERRVGHLVFGTVEDERERCKAAGTAVGSALYNIIIYNITADHAPSSAPLRPPPR